MNTAKFISTYELEKHLGTMQLKDPWKFGKALESSQDWELYKNDKPRHTILFNKGRYFETSIYDRKLRSSIAQAIKVKVVYENMICASWRKMPAFIKAMNKRGIYVDIGIDWI